MNCRRGTLRAEDAQGTPTQGHIPPSVLVYEENSAHWSDFIQTECVSGWGLRKEPGVKGSVLNLTTTSSQKCAAVPRRAHILGTKTFASLNCRLESNKEEEEVRGFHALAWLMSQPLETRNVRILNARSSNL